LAAVAFDYLNSDLEWYVKQKGKGKGREVDNDTGAVKKDSEASQEGLETIAMEAPRVEQECSVKEPEPEQKEEKGDAMDVDSHKENEGMDRSDEHETHQENLPAIEESAEMVTAVVAVVQTDSLAEQTAANDDEVERDHDTNETTATVDEDEGGARDSAIEVGEDDKEAQAEDAKQMVADVVPVEGIDETRETKWAEDKEQEVELQDVVEADSDVHGRTQEEKITVQQDSATLPGKEDVSSAALPEGIMTDTQEEEPAVEAVAVENVAGDEEIVVEVQSKSVDVDEKQEVSLNMEQEVEQPTYTEASLNDAEETVDSGIQASKTESKPVKRKHSGESSVTPKRKKKRRGPPGISASEFRRLFPNAHVSRSRESSPETALGALLAHSPTMNVKDPETQRKRSPSESSESDAPLATLVGRRNMSPAKHSLDPSRADNMSPSSSHDFSAIQELVSGFRLILSPPLTHRSTPPPWSNQLGESLNHVLPADNLPHPSPVALKRVTSKSRP
jgi:hypothetical protein